MGLRGVFVILVLLFAGHADAQAPSRRLALIIANDAYQGYAPLNNPRADATLVAASLQRAGFATVRKENLGFAEMVRTLGAFATSARGADIALVYYAGHGIEVGGRNWLIPVDAQLTSDTELRFQAVDAASLVDAGAEARSRVVVLDACRDNPFLPRMRRTVIATRDATPGLAAPSQSDTARGTLVMLSAAPGELAADGPAGQSSPFARAFARWLPEPDLELRIAAGKIADSVFDETRERQLPHYISTLSGAPIVLVASPPRPAPIDPETARLRQRVQDLETQEKNRASTQPNTPASATGPRLLHTLTGHTGASHIGAFSADGRLLATSSADMTTRIWRVSDGANITAISEPGCFSQAVSFTPDSAAVLGRCENGARVWSASTGARSGQIRGITGYIERITPSHNRTLVAFSTRDGTSLVNAQTRAVLSTIPDFGTTIAFSIDDGDILIGNLSGVASLWDIRDPTKPRKRWTLTGLGAISAVDVGQLQYVIGNQNGDIVVYSFGRVYSRLPSQNSYVRQVIFAPGGPSELLTVTSGGGALWEVQFGESRRKTLSLARSPSYAIDIEADYSLNGRRLAWVQGDETVTLWDARTGGALGQLAAPDGEIASALQFSPDNRTLAVAYKSGTVRLWAVD